MKRLFKALLALPLSAVVLFMAFISALVVIPTVGLWYIVHQLTKVDGDPPFLQGFLDKLNEAAAKRHQKTYQDDGESWKKDHDDLYNE